MKKRKILKEALLLLVICLCIPNLPVAAKRAIEDKKNVDDIAKNIYYATTSIEIISYNTTYVEDSNVAIYVNKMRNDPTIQQIIAREAVDPEGWWKWFDSLPQDHSILMSKRSAMEWLEDIKSLTPEQRAMLGNNILVYTANSTDSPLLCDAPEGNPAANLFADVINPGGGFLPVGGWEHEYDYAYWSHPDRKNHANCYLYSLNCYGGRDDIQVPGNISGNYQVDPYYIIPHLDELIKRDAPFFNNKTIVNTTASAKPGYRQYKIAAFTSDVDFHFYRQDNTGYWSHKPGKSNISQYDASGYKIVNPCTANRNYDNGISNYKNFVGFYMVTY